MDNNSQPNYENEIVLINLIVDGGSIAYRPKDGCTDLALSSEIIVYFYENILKVNL